MKQLIFSLAAFFVVFFFSVTVLAVGDRSARVRKLDDALSQVVEETLYEVMENSEGVCLNDSDIKKEIKDKLSLRLSERAELDVKVDAFDPKLGILSVSVTESFIHPNGKRGTIDNKKTVILEQQMSRSLVEIEYLMPQNTPELSSTYTDGFDATYMKCELQTGDRLLLPDDPPDMYVPQNKSIMSHYVFKEWMIKKSDGSEVPLLSCKDELVGSERLSFDGKKNGKIVLVADYEMEGN